jgi:hypothetical protein
MSPKQSEVRSGSFLPVSPFTRLAALLGGIDPGGTPIDLTVGGPRHPMSDLVMDTLGEAAAGFGTYPPITGTEAFRSSARDWLGQRYPVLAGLGEDSLGMIPLAGTREGVFHVVFSAKARRPEVVRLTVLLPNPFYRTYAEAAASAGLEMAFLRAGPEIGFVPDLDAIDSSISESTVAFLLCSPANPQGAVPNEDYLEQASEMARKYHFILIADECYSEIYTETPPPGAHEVSQRRYSRINNVVSMQSCRSGRTCPACGLGSVPAIRSSFPSSPHSATSSCHRCLCPSFMPTRNSLPTKLMLRRTAHSTAKYSRPRGEFCRAGSAIAGGKEVFHLARRRRIWRQRRDRENTLERLWRQTVARMLSRTRKSGRFQSGRRLRARGDGRRSGDHARRARAHYRDVEMRTGKHGYSNRQQ